MSAATVISEAYGKGACLYETVLGVSSDATPSQLRKAYYKRCLSYHPDKLASDLPDEEIEGAKSKFRAISVAYSILSDESKRKEYDESGDFYDEDDDMATSKGGVDSWKEYFDALFPKVTGADIDAFEVKYKCSDEEERDVLKYYARFKGDLNKMLECVMLSSDVDKARWVEDYIRPAIERGEADDHAARIEKTLGGKVVVAAKTTTTTRARGGGEEKRNVSRGGGRGGKKAVVEKTTDEDEGSDDESDTPMAQVVGGAKDRASSVSADASSSKKGKLPSSKKTSGETATTDASKKKKASSSSSSSACVAGDDDLFARIRGNALARRREGFDSLMAGLEERYGGGVAGDEKKKTGRAGSKKKRQQDDGDIMDDDEFAKIQAKIMKNKGNR